MLGLKISLVCALSLSSGGYGLAPRKPLRSRQSPPRPARPRVGRSACVALAVPPLPSGLSGTTAGVATALVAASVGGLVAEERTAIGRALTGAMVTFGLTAVASNARLLPNASPLYDACWSTVLPLSLAVTVISQARSPPSASPASASTTALGSTSASAASVATSKGSNEKASPRPMRGVGLAFACGAVGSLLGAAVSFWLVAVRFGMMPLHTAGG